MKTVESCLTPPGRGLTVSHIMPPGKFQALTLRNEEPVIQVPWHCAGLQSARHVHSDPSPQKGQTEIYDICKNIYCFWSTVL